MFGSVPVWQRQSSDLETSVVVAAAVVAHVTFFLVEYHGPEMKLFFGVAGGQLVVVVALGTHSWQRTGSL